MMMVSTLGFRRMATAIIVCLALAATSMAPTGALSKQARCYNTDDGYYACNFRQFGGDGSFEISAPARPTYTVSLVDRGMADGFADYGNGSGNIRLPGTFWRSSDDRACWVSDATDFAICAY